MQTRIVLCRKKKLLELSILLGFKKTQVVKEYLIVCIHFLSRIND